MSKQETAVSLVGRLMRRVRKHTSGCVVRLSQRLDPEILLHYGIGFSSRGKNEEQPSRVFQVPHQRKLLASQWNKVEGAKRKKSSAWAAHNVIADSMHLRLAVRYLKA